MSGKPIQITQFDLERLQKLLLEARATDYRKSEYLEKRQAEIDRAQVVQHKDIPSDVVTMTVSPVDETRTVSMRAMKPGRRSVRAVPGV